MSDLLSAQSNVTLMKFMQSVLVPCKEIRLAISMHSLFSRSFLGGDLVGLWDLVVAELLLEILVSLHTSSDGGRSAGLPGRSSDVRDAGGVLEDSSDLLEWFSGRLWEKEEDVQPHGNTEHAEDDIHMPSDVDESRRNEVAESKVEGPVSRGCKSSSLCANTVGEDFLLKSALPENCLSRYRARGLQLTEG